MRCLNLEGDMESKAEGPEGSGGVGLVGDGIAAVGEAPDGVEVEDAEDVADAYSDLGVETACGSRPAHL